MVRLRTAVAECKYKEVDRQLKEQFIHGLKDSEMLTEVIRELTKCKENVIIPSEIALVCIKRVEAQRAQTVVISSLHDLKISFMQSYIKKIVSGTRNMQVTQSSPEKDASMIDKNINQDNAHHLVKGVTNSSSSTLKLKNGMQRVPDQHSQHC